MSDIQSLAETVLAIRADSSRRRPLSPGGERHCLKMSSASSTDILSSGEDIRAPKTSIAQEGSLTRHQISIGQVQQVGCRFVPGTVEG